VFVPARHTFACENTSLLRTFVNYKSKMWCHGATYSRFYADPKQAKNLIRTVSFSCYLDRQKSFKIWRKKNEISIVSQENHVFPVKSHYRKQAQNGKKKQKQSLLKTSTNKVFFKDFANQWFVSNLDPKVSFSSVKTVKTFRHHFTHKRLFCLSLASSFRLI
jgi:hypothetical protein